MSKLILDLLVPFGIGVLLLVFPQWFTKKDLKAEENLKLAKRLKTIGWALLAAGVLVFVVMGIKRMFHY